MTHNDVFRRVRSMLSLDDAAVIAVFAEAEHTVTIEQVKAWRAWEDAPHFDVIPDRDLALFLNGLIVTKRGRRPGPLPEPEKVLDNNLVAKKLRIALNLQGDDLMAAVKRAGFSMSEHELSAFFRKPGHKHYRVMNDQVLRYLMRGLRMELRPDWDEDEAGDDTP